MMKVLKYVLACFFIISGFTAQGVKRTGLRETVNFNKNWKYIQGDCPGAEASDFDDVGWMSVGLPHSFSIPYFQSRDFYVGYGWYRKQFNLDAGDLKKEMTLEFDGVFQDAEVFVNGQRCGSHKGGYTGFEINITGAVHSGRNTVAVRVNNLWRPDLAPRAGEHVFSGGIYRNVRLVKKNPVHIDWCGTKIIVQGLEESDGRRAVVGIVNSITNSSGKTLKVKVETLVKDAGGRIVGKSDTVGVLQARSTRTFEQKTGGISNPSLWHPEHPTMYTVESNLFINGTKVDTSVEPLGFRWLRWTADNGMYLNGERYYLKGANVHQDQAGWGDAVTDSAIWRDVRMIKEAGFNFIRGSHYPHAPSFVEACDKLGVLFWSEAPFWGIGGFKKDGYWNSSAYPVNEEVAGGFEESALQQLEEMIRIHRNHPSVIVWSMCNEPFFSAPQAMDGVRRLLKRMVDRSRELDSSRPAAIGGCQRPLGDKRIDRIGDLCGYNGDGASLPDFQNPGVPNIVSEYGSVTSDRPGKYAPGWGDLRNDSSCMTLPWRSGQSIWCAFDHGSLAGNALGKMGIVDYFRIPKRAWYWYRKAYSGVEPPEWAQEGTPRKVCLKASKYSGVLSDGTDDVQLTVSIIGENGKEISNSPEVGLKIVSGPGEFPTGRSLVFSPGSDIRIMDGKAAIAVRAYHSGVSRIIATSPGLESDTVEIEFMGDSPFIDGVTEVCKDRPYTRFVRSDNSGAVLKFGRHNPTFASSNHPEHSSALAADDDRATYWRAGVEDNNPSLTLDTEKLLQITGVTLSFPDKGHYRFVVETSSDRKNWFTMIDRSTEAECVESLKYECKDHKVSGRFVRISFVNGSPAALSEMEVFGIVLK